MPGSPADLRKRSQSLLDSGQNLLNVASTDAMVEFAVTLSSFTEYLNAQGLPGLHQLSRSVEEEALALLDASDNAAPPAATALTRIVQRARELAQQVSDFLDGSQPAMAERRSGSNTSDPSVRHRVWIFGNSGSAWQELALQLGHFNVEAAFHQLRNLPGLAEQPTLVLFSVAELQSTQAIEQISLLRQHYAASALLVHQLPGDFDILRAALAAGADHCLPPGTTAAQLLDRILDLCSGQQEEAYRALVVEDSLTASKSIERSLALCGIQTQTLARPQQVLDTLARFQPDLILLDMYLPGCTGLEVAQVIRQHPEFLSIPIVYLSGDNHVPTQVQALRLGGDHFLTKPYNPVVLNAVVQSKIERYRTLRRAMERDSLTGLYNHSTSKALLGQAMRQAHDHGLKLSTAMVDIDHFKKINDSHGHPMGDQVIRNLAWFLRQRLRRSDLIGRYGGEEFLLVLQGADATQAAALLDRIRHDFSQIRHPSKEAWCSATVSAGVAQLHGDTSAEALIKQADEALYEAKRQGRDRIVTAT